MQHPFHTLAGVICAATAALVLLVACGNGDDNANGDETPPSLDPPIPTAEANGPSGLSEDEAEIQQIIRTVVDAYNAGDVEEFLAHWTDDGLESEFAATAAEIRASPSVYFGGPPGGIQLGDFHEVDIENGAATVEFEFVFGLSVSFQRYDLTEEGGEWLIAGTDEVEIDLPDGVSVVEVGLTEFEFEFDPSEVGDGNVAFAFQNEGEVLHEAVLLQVPEGFTVQDLAAIQGGELPPGLELIGGVGPFAPGDGGNLVLRTPLPEGHYMLLCFLPDEEDAQGTPHALQGMEAGFQVPAP